MPVETPPTPPHAVEPEIVEHLDGGVTTITLNRPKALNSFTVTMLAALLAALERAANDTRVRCVVLTGAGRAFSAGQDLSDPAAAPDASPDAKPKDLGALITQSYRPVALRLRSMPVPTLAAVNGVAAGAGANLALGCDIVVAAQAASFIQAFSKIGLIPDTGGTWLLPRQVGRARALALAMLGDKLAAQDAERIGLIWRCVETAELPVAAMVLARQLAAMPSRALATTRAAIDQAVTMTFDQALAAEAAMQSTLGAAADYREGVRAFIDKRAPTFTDR